MPRGRKKKVVLTLDQKIEAVKNEIAALSKQLKEKKAEFKSLSDEKANEKRTEFIAAVEASGKSYDDILAMLKKAK